MPTGGNVSIVAAWASDNTKIASASVAILAPAVGTVPPLMGSDANNLATYYEADASLKAWTDEFVVQTPTTAYFAAHATSVTTAEKGGYGEALTIAVFEDAYERTHDPAQLVLLNKMIPTFEAFTGRSWAGDGWIDDIGWMVNVYTRAYQITGNPDYLKIAEDNWNAAYAKGWSSDLGGGLWELTDTKDSKQCLSNNSFVWEGVVLYRATGDTTYLTKAEAIYAWVRSHLFNFTNSVTTDASGSLAPGQLSQGMTPAGVLQSSNDNLYNSGTFVLAADSLYQETGTQQYYDDAVHAITHVVNKWPIVSTRDSSGGSQWAYFFFKGLSQFATHNNLWPTYYPWMLNNANAAWAQRDGNNITSNNWTTPTVWTTKDQADALPSSSAVAIWQLLELPTQSTLVNLDDQLALAVGQGDKTNNAQIEQDTPLAAGSAQQQFMVVATPDKHSAIISALTGMAVSISGASSANGAPVVDSQYRLGDTSQEFDLPGKVDLVKNVPGYVAIINVNSGSNMDEGGWGKSAGQPAIQWGNNPAPEANQLWTIAPVVSFGGKYELQNMASGLALTVLASSTTSGASVVQDIFDAKNAADTWTFVPAGNGFYSIQNVKSGMSITMSGTSNTTGTLGVQGATGTQARSLFRPEKNADGSYTFYEAANGLVIENPSASAMGAQIGQAVPSGLGSQGFALIPQ